MDQSTFSFQLTPSNPTVCLGFETWIDDHCVFDTDHVQETVTITANLPSDDVEGQHVLKFVLKNKQAEHTQLDENGHIISDAVLTISNLAFDSIELGYLVDKLTRYTHNFNGTQDTITESFYATMGCNGTVELTFTTPIYLWLLENM